MHQQVSASFGPSVYITASRITSSSIVARQTSSSGRMSTSLISASTGTTDGVFKEFWNEFRYKQIECRHFWTSYRSNLCDTSKIFCSPRFKSDFREDDDSKIEWLLQMRSSENKVQIHLSLASVLDADNLTEKIKNCIVDYSISILDAEGKVFRKLVFNKSTFSTDRKPVVNYRDFKYFNKQDILDNLLSNDCHEFKILCELSYWIPVVTQLYSSPEISSEQMECVQELSSDFSGLHSDPKFTDVTLCAGSKEFMAHKAILAARSPVFRAMFDCDMLEKRQNRVEIEHVREEILGEMLEFIYTGKASNLDQNAQELLVAADRYDLPKLKVLAESNLASKLSVDNAVEQLIFADTSYSSARLKTGAVNFIVANLEAVRGTTGWNEMVEVKPKIMDYIMKSVIEKCKEKNISLN